MGYFSMSAKCFLCNKDLGLLTCRGRWELADEKWLCIDCAKKAGLNTMQVKQLTSDDINRIIDEKNGILRENENGVIYDVLGVRGRRLKVFEDKCIIEVAVGAGSLLTGNVSDGEKTIYFTDVIGVQFKKSAVQIGYLQLETATSLTNNIQNNFFNENSFTFDIVTTTNERMEEVANYVKERIDLYKKRPKDNKIEFSSADEILKFKKLCDEGIISEEEFEKKKKQLLEL